MVCAYAAYLLLGRIGGGLAMLNLWSREGIEDFTMGSV